MGEEYQVILGRRSREDLKNGAFYVPEIGLREVREVIFKSYRIVYRISGTHVQILRFWHAARGVPELSIDDFQT